MAYVRKDLDRLNDLYWNLYHKHERLMAHLGLIEQEKSGVEIRTKGAPEQCS
jgi:hypothetical protein